MAYAMVKGQRHEVRVIQDLAENFSLEVFPTPAPGLFKAAEPFKNWPVPLCIKLRADSKAHALEAGLAHMKQLGTIDEFHIDAHERPAPDAPKVKKDDDEDEEATEEDA
ncbi:MAG: hypothetical protein ACT4TC_15400 [Myxococcaceae bacterium]